MNRCKALFAAIACGLALSTASASEQPKAAPAGPGVADFALDRTDAAPVAASTRLVVFRYSDQVSFTIRSIPGAFTNVEVPDGETIQGFYLSDPAAWGFHVTEDKARVLIKPAAAGAYTTGTMVTDKRSYELTLIAVEPGQPWMQRARWEIGDATANGIYEPEPIVDEQGSTGVTPEKMNFGYNVRGRAEFAPTVVFDDGVRTWFKLGPSQDLPAIFAITDGKVDVVDMVRRGEFVVVPRLSSEWRLRLHSDEVTVRRGR